MSRLGTSPPNAIPESRPPQFSLRAMFYFMTGLCLLLELWCLLPAGWFWGLLFLALMIGAHVLGNALGTKLRDEGRRGSPAVLGENTTAEDPVPSADPPPRPVLPIGRLQEKTPLAQLHFLLVPAWGLLGAMLGLFALSNASSPISGPGYLVGTLAAAVIAGIFGFLLSSLLATLTGSLLQAQRSLPLEELKQSPPAVLIPEYD